MALIVQKPVRLQRSNARRNVVLEPTRTTTPNACSRNPAFICQNRTSPVLPSTQQGKPEDHERLFHHHPPPVIILTVVASACSVHTHSTSDRLTTRRAVCTPSSRTRPSLYFNNITNAREFWGRRCASTYPDRRATLSCPRSATYQGRMVPWLASARTLYGSE